MNLYSFKESGRKAVQPLMKHLIRVHPNTITWTSIVFSVCAGICYIKSEWNWPLLIGPIFILMRMCCNLLDGMVALSKNIASPKGEALQEAIDRIADVIILLGIIFSPFGHLPLGLITIPLVLISSYLGILSKAVGGVRIYKGVLSKGDRLFLIIVFSVIQFFWKGRLYNLHIFSILLLIFIVGGIITILQRSFIIKRA